MSTLGRSFEQIRYFRPSTFAVRPPSKMLNIIYNDGHSGYTIYLIYVLLIKSIVRYCNLRQLTIAFGFWIDICQHWRLPKMRFQDKISHSDLPPLLLSLYELKVRYYILLITYYTLTHPKFGNNNRYYYTFNTRDKWWVHQSNCYFWMKTLDLNQKNIYIL
jgi:hypothetical protein